VLPFLNRKDILNLTNVKFKQDVERHLENIHKNDIKVITLEDECILRTLKTYMILLWFLYEGNHSRGGKYLAVVGSRRATSYGLDMAKKISRELAECGITVVSGMARGVDSFAIWELLK